MKFKTISLKRGYCYGACPVYTATIHNDGLVEWMGLDFVKEKGLKSWMISKKEIDALRRALKKAQFFDFRKEYTKHYMTDHARVTIKVKFEDGLVKKVEHYLGDYSAPTELEWLENKIDEIAGTAPYIGPE